MLSCLHLLCVSWAFVDELTMFHDLALLAPCYTVVHSPCRKRIDCEGEGASRLRVQTCEGFTFFQCPFSLNSMHPCSFHLIIIVN